MNEQRERAAFEEWARANRCGGDLRWYTGGLRYLNLYTEGAWQAWKARAALAAGVTAAHMPLVRCTECDWAGPATAAGGFHASDCPRCGAPVSGVAPTEGMSNG